MAVIRGFRAFLLRGNVVGAAFNGDLTPTGSWATIRIRRRMWPPASREPRIRRRMRS